MYLIDSVPGTTHVMIYLDGVQVKYVLEGDDTEGWLTVICQDTNGKFIVDHDSAWGVAVERKHGHVEFRWDDDKYRQLAQSVQEPNMREKMQFFGRIKDTEAEERGRLLEERAARTGKTLKEVFFDDIGVR